MFDLNSKHLFNNQSRFAIANELVKMRINNQRLHFDRFTVEDFVYPPSLYMPPHADKLSRISIILAGELQESNGLQNVNATKGYLVIKPKHIVHENVFGNAPVRSLSISFHDDHLFAEYFRNWQWIKHPKINILGIRFWAEARKLKNEEKLMQCFDEFLSAVITLKHDTPTPLAWIEELKQLLEGDPSKAVSIDQLSEKLCLHRVYLSRAFKKHYGSSPVEFRKYIKIAAAFFDVVLTTRSLAGIAYDSGFSDQSHMTREFIKCLGYTPAAFRRLMTKM